MAGVAGRELRRNLDGLGGAIRRRGLDEIPHNDREVVRVRGAKEVLDPLSEVV